MYLGATRASVPISRAMMQSQRPAILSGRNPGKIDFEEGQKRLAAQAPSAATLKRRAYEARLKQLEKAGMSGPEAIAQARAEGLYVSAF